MPSTRHDAHEAARHGSRYFVGVFLGSINKLQIALTTTKRLTSLDCCDTAEAQSQSAVIVITISMLHR